MPPQGLGAKRQLLLWLVTIRKHKVLDWVDPLELDSVALQVFNDPSVEVDTYADEIDPTYLQLHRHLLIKTPSSWRFTQTSLDGYRVHYLRCALKDASKLRCYIHKNGHECHLECNSAYNGDYIH